MHRERAIHAENSIFEQGRQFDAHCKALEEERSLASQRLYEKILFLGNELQRVQDQGQREVEALKDDNNKMKLSMQNERVLALNTLLRRMGCSAQDVLYLIQILYSMNGHLLK